MSDLINRQDAIDALGERPLAWTQNEYETGLQNQYDCDLEAIQNVPSAQQWISVTERLPENNGTYIVDGEWYFTPDHVDEKNHCRRVFTAYYSDVFGWDLEAEEIYAWMPLPEPFEQQESEGKE